MIDSSRMVGRQNRQLGDARISSKPTLIASLWAGLSLARDEARLADLARQLDLEPVGRVVPAD